MPTRSQWCQCHYNERRRLVMVTTGEDRSTGCHSMIEIFLTAQIDWLKILFLISQFNIKFLYLNCTKSHRIDYNKVQTSLWSYYVCVSRLPRKNLEYIAHSPIPEYDIFADPKIKNKGKNVFAVREAENSTVQVHGACVQCTRHINR